MTRLRCARPPHLGLLSLGVVIVINDGIIVSDVHQRSSRLCVACVATSMVSGGALMRHEVWGRHLSLASVHITDSVCSAVGMHRTELGSDNGWEQYNTRRQDCMLSYHSIT